MIYIIYYKIMFQKFVMIKNDIKDLMKPLLHNMTFCHSLFEEHQLY